MPRIRALIIAYHFPPLHGSSGILRTLKFVRYLPQHGIEPIVLTVHPRAYEKSNDALLAQLPSDLRVHRSFALDAGKHLSFGGRYPACFAWPDRYSTWVPAGIWDGYRLIARHKIDLIFSTYPVPSAHLIGLALSRLTGKPWIADFRDPMWDEYTTMGSRIGLSFRKWIEAEAMSRSRVAIANTPGMKNLFAARYPGLPPGKLEVIPNGYDENDFSALPPPGAPKGPPFLFIHTGLLEPADRDPVPFFRGLRIAIDRGACREGEIEVRLYASSNEESYRSELESLRLGGIVKLLPPVPYAETLGLMAAANVLLLFQGPSCDNQVPAKLYEYFRTGKPILALTTDTGETGKLVSGLEAGEVVPSDDTERIASALGAWMERLRNGGPLPSANKQAALRFSRQEQAKTLAALMARVTGKS